MKKTVAFLLTLSLLLVFASCKSEGKYDAYEIYSEALESTTALDYFKVNMTLSTSTNDEKAESREIRFKIIKEDSKITLFSEKSVEAVSGKDSITVWAQSHYIDGVMYQTFSETKMKHALSTQELFKKHPDAKALLLTLPETLLEEVEVSSAGDDGQTFKTSFDPKKLDSSEQKKLKNLIFMYSKSEFDGDFTLSDTSLEITTTYDGYFDTYKLSFSALGKVNGKETEETLTLDIKVINPGSMFTIEPPKNLGSYKEGEFDIG